MVLVAFGYVAAPQMQLEGPDRSVVLDNIEQFIAHYSPGEEYDYRERIDSYSTKYRLPPEYVAGILYAESRFDKTSISSKFCRGPGQVSLYHWGWALTNEIADGFVGECMRATGQTNARPYMYTIEFGVELTCYVFRYILDNFQPVNSRALLVYGFSDGLRLSKTKNPADYAYVRMVYGVARHVRCGSEFYRVSI
jgi:hypothetical protein